MAPEDSVKETSAPSDQLEKIWSAIGTLRVALVELGTKYTAWSETATKEFERVANALEKLDKGLEDFKTEYQKGQVDFVTLKTKFAGKEYAWMSIGSSVLAVAAIIVSIVLAMKG